MYIVMRKILAHTVKKLEKTPNALSVSRLNADKNLSNHTQVNGISIFAQIS